ncbi:DUF2730 family protein [Mesorhizobium sp.]|uniref:DUF2730 family protein n=1 Tax=Mesorhizobium sp. TaxID=1871066 RepID=UPI000FE5F4C5|nr:DUF2730 family protein [Mesorhizobium sp.]RWC58906.1 MAG: DUF2730 family protein [Mesorhizobium sp.]RWC66518.1 MAG: DUF2730 family protein [Mesorhizobium sp.]
MDQIKDWAGLIAILISIGGVLYGWLTSGSSKALKDLAALREEIDADADVLAKERRVSDAAIVGRFQMAEERLIKLESDFQHLPEREQVHRIELAVEKLSGSLAAMSERITPISALASRLQELEFERASGK